jgi:hypothetical protein
MTTTLVELDGYRVVRSLGGAIHMVRSLSIFVLRNGRVVEPGRE